jgi:hypothetical protein
VQAAKILRMRAPATIDEFSAERHSRGEMENASRLRH